MRISAFARPVLLGAALLLVACKTTPDGAESPDAAEEEARAAAEASARAERSEVTEADDAPVSSDDDPAAEGCESDFDCALTHFDGDSCCMACRPRAVTTEWLEVHQEQCATERHACREMSCAPGPRREFVPICEDNRCELAPLDAE